MAPTNADGDSPPTRRAPQPSTVRIDSQSDGPPTDDGPSAGDGLPADDPAGEVVR